MLPFDIGFLDKCASVNADFDQLMKIAQILGKQKKPLPPKPPAPKPSPVPPPPGSENSPVDLYGRKWEDSN